MQQRSARGSGRFEKVPPPSDPRDDDLLQIVHDLKGPLSTIALEAWLLDDKLANGDCTDARAAVARITQNVEFLDRMVQNLLEERALDSGDFELQTRSIDVRALLQQVVDRVVSTRDRGRVRVEAPRSTTLALDELRIGRVIANLIGNAVKYSPRHGEIVIRLHVDARSLRVSVIDAGPGLSGLEMAYVFDKYRRAPSARMCEGSGLGLYVSRKIIEAHGGQIAVECAGGTGAHFFFDLPVV